MAGTISNARHSYSTTLHIDPAGGNNYQTIAEVMEITGPGIKDTVTKRTNVDSPSAYQEKIPGLVDAGQVTFKLNMTETQYSALLGMIRKPTMSVVVLFPLTGTQTAQAILQGSGHISDLGMSIPDDDRITCDVTIEASGPWAFTPGTPEV